MSTPVIEVRGVGKTFRKPRPVRRLLLPHRPEDNVLALRDVSFSLTPGETVGIVGKNGAGKSTLLRILAGLIEPDSGSASINGHDAAKDPVAARAALGLVLANERSFFWRISARENLRFFALLQHIPPSRMNDEVSLLIDTVELGENADRPYKDLSEGMRQRLAIARGLIGDSEVLLMDEATLHLDPGTRKKMAEVFRTRRDGSARTMLVVSHNLAEIRELCARVICLEHGAVALDAPLAEAGDRLESLLGRGDGHD